MKKIIKTLSDIGVVDTLQVALLILKLTKTVDWSWWIIFAPALFNIALISIVAILVLGFNIYVDIEE